MNKKLKIYENLYEILSDSEPEPSGESLLNINREESEINLIFSQEDNESLITTPTTIITLLQVQLLQVQLILYKKMNLIHQTLHAKLGWEFFSKEYNDKQEIITYICIICKNQYNFFLLFFK